MSRRCYIAFELRYGSDGKLYAYYTDVRGAHVYDIGSHEDLFDHPPLPDDWDAAEDICMQYAEDFTESLYGLDVD